eukprot:471881_1
MESVNTYGNHKQWARQKHVRRVNKLKYVNKKRKQIMRMKSSRDYNSYQTEFEDYNFSYLKKICKYFPNQTTQNVKQMIKNTKPTYVVQDRDEIELYYKPSLQYIHENMDDKILFINDKIPLQNEYEICPDTADILPYDEDDLIIDMGKHTMLTSFGIFMNNYARKHGKEFKVYVSNKTLKTKKEIKQFTKMGSCTWCKHQLKKYGYNGKERKTKKEQWIDMNWKYIGWFGKTINKKIYNKLQVKHKDKIQQIYAIGDDYKGILCRYIKIKIVNWWIDECNWSENIMFYGTERHSNTTVVRKCPPIYHVWRHQIRLQFDISPPYVYRRGRKWNYYWTNRSVYRAQRKRNYMADIKQSICDMTDINKCEHTFKHGKQKKIVKLAKPLWYSFNSRKKKSKLSSKISTTHKLQYNVLVTINLATECWFYDIKSFMNSNAIKYYNLCECKLYVSQKQTNYKCISYSLAPSTSGYNKRYNPIKRNFNIVIPVQNKNVFDFNNPLKSVASFIWLSRFNQLTIKPKWNAIDVRYLNAINYYHILLKTLLEFIDSHYICKLILFQYVGTNSMNHTMNGTSNDEIVYVRSMEPGDMNWYEIIRNRIIKNMRIYIRYVVGFQQKTYRNVKTCVFQSNTVKNFERRFPEFVTITQDIVCSCIETYGYCNNIEHRISTIRPQNVFNFEHSACGIVKIKGSIILNKSIWKMTSRIDNKTQSFINANNGKLPFKLYDTKLSIIRKRKYNQITNNQKK